VFNTSGCYATRFVDNGDGTVTDHVTGLQWEQKDNLDNVVNDADPHDADNTYTWCSGGFGLNCTNSANPPDGTAYTDFLAKLNAGTSGNAIATSGCFAGHCDWRVPTITELQTILLAPYPCGTTPCINPAFGPTQANFYWSATTFEAGVAWEVIFGPAGTSSDLETRDHYVRAVRGGS
jgi:hypothetical protein